VQKLHQQEMHFMCCLAGFVPLHFVHSYTSSNSHGLTCRSTAPNAYIANIFDPLPTAKHLPV
jgi:hypothetical protein